MTEWQDGDDRGNMVTITLWDNDEKGGVESHVSFSREVNLHNEGETPLSPAEMLALQMLVAGFPPDDSGVDWKAGLANEGEENSDASTGS